MLIKGIQKTSLVDYPGLIGCTLFTSGCNFACPYCHNPSLVIEHNQKSINLDQVFSFLEKRSGLLDGICISGGEPLMQTELKEFIEKVKRMGYLIKLDTNGSLPQRLKALLDLDLIDYIAMDIKHKPTSYSAAIGINDYSVENVNQSISYIMDGQVDYEFRTTAVKGIHIENDFEYIGRWIKGAKAYYIQNYKQAKQCIGDYTDKTLKLESFSEKELEGIVKIIKKNVRNVQVRSI